LAAVYGNPNHGIGLAARVILHLARLDRIGPNDIPSIESTQQGMAAAFDVRQGSLVKVLQRLRAGEVVTVERRFVAGADRHMKVYRLTPLGEATARNIRRRTLEPARPHPNGEWVSGRPASD
jgi:DNA-binding PadR family transcriptional regulator